MRNRDPHEPISCGNKLVCKLRPLRLLLLAGLGGCSVCYEAKRPDFTNVNAIEQGTPRYDVAGIMGRPLVSYKQDGKDVDVFQADPNGRYQGTKAAVTTFNAVADAFTICMWEAVATPAEMLTQHKLTTYVVTYGPDERVESIRTTAKEPAQLQADASQPADASSPSSNATPAAAQAVTANVASSDKHRAPAAQSAHPSAAPSPGANQALGVSVPSARPT